MRLKYFPLLLISIFSMLRLTAQTPPTELLILGTIHNGNKHFDHKTLYTYLEQQKPDIILREQADPYKKVKGLKTAHFLKIAKPSIEQLALQQYSEKYSQVPILPYDMDFGSRKDYLKQLIEMESRFFRQMNEAKMNPDDSLQYARYADQRNSFYSLIEQSTLFRINQPDLMDTARELYRKDAVLILPLARKYLQDSLLVEKFRKDLDFWRARNEFMSHKIARYISQYPGKKILVLCGLNHKYYLTDEIRKMPGLNMCWLETTERFP